MYSVVSVLLIPGSVCLALCIVERRNDVLSSVVTFVVCVLFLSDITCYVFFIVAQ